MFDSLLGRKFTVRCKQAIKCINERLKVIRKRKQAMLNFLRQDIADLLRDGHDSNALNRMDALIVEINHLACYDKIGKFCESILRQISLLQKQRECPDEEKEAVSTLIFAAARFSDLPELCDLRHTFMSRYESAMEASVCLEFIEKLSSRTFPMTSKFQLMHKIAQEFSVEWVSEPLEYGSSDSVASQCANGKYGDKNDGMCQVPISTIKDLGADTKDIHIIGLEPEPTPTRRRSKICDDELENVNPCPPDTSIPYPKRDKDGRYTSPRAREVGDQIDQEGKVLDGSKVTPPCDGDGHGKYEFKNEDKSIRAHLIRPKAIKDAIDSDDNRKQSTRDQDEFENDVNPIKIPPYLKSRAVNGALHPDDWNKDESPKESSEKAGKDADIAAQGRQMDGPCKSYNDRSQFHMIPPPYLKLKVSAAVDHSDPSSPPAGDGGFAAGNRSSNVGNDDPPQRHELVVDHGRPKPRSVRRNIKKSPVVAQESDGEPMRGIQHGQRRHVARKNTSPHQDEYVSGEEDIDRLLTHYSKKKTPHQSRKHGENTHARHADHAGDRCGVDQHQTSEQYNDNKLGPAARVTSMQPDALSPSGGHAHQNLPDYEEFAARFAALRRG